MMSYPVRESTCESHPFFHLPQDKVQKLCIKDDNNEGNEILVSEEAKSFVINAHDDDRSGVDVVATETNSPMESGCTDLPADKPDEQNTKVHDEAPQDGSDEETKEDEVPASKPSSSSSSFVLDKDGKDSVTSAYQAFFFANTAPAFELVELNGIVANDISSTILKWLCMTDQELYKQKTGFFSGESYRAQLVRLLHEMTD